MPPRSESSRRGAPVLLSAPGLSVVALVLFVLFATLVAGAVWPVQLLNPLWQLRLAGRPVNGAPFALLGLALLQIAVELGPHDPRLKSRQKLCSQLAVIAGLGFLLLVPLMGVAGLQQSRSITSVQSSRINGAERRLVALRQAVASANSNAEVNQRLQRLQGPVLGFAALAVRPGSEDSLLQEWQEGWGYWQWRLQQRRGSTRDGTSDEEYIRQLSGEERDS